MHTTENNTQKIATAQDHDPAPVSSKIDNTIYGLRALTHRLASDRDAETLKKCLAVLTDAAARVRTMERVRGPLEDE